MHTTIIVDEVYRHYTVKDLMEHLKKLDFIQIEILCVEISDRNRFKRCSINEIKEIEQQRLSEVFETIEIFDDLKGNRIATLIPIKERSKNA